MKEKVVGLQEIDDWAFFNTSLKKIHLPANLSQIGQGAFFRCNLTTIHIPEMVRVIPYFCFAKCSLLTSASFSRHLERIEALAFAGCSSLHFVDVSVDRILSRAFFLSGIRELTINQCKEIGDEAFFKNEQLNVIHLPRSLRKVKRGAFDWCLGVNHVYYEGCKEEWNEIEIGRCNLGLYRGKLFFNLIQ